MKLGKEQLERLTAHIHEQHENGEITWEKTPIGDSFRAKLKSGAELFASLWFGEDGEVRSMPCIVTDDKGSSVNLHPRDERMIDIGKHIAKENGLRTAVATATRRVVQGPHGEGAEDFLRSVGVSDTPERREQKIKQVIGQNDEKAGVIERIKGIFRRGKTQHDAGARKKIVEH